MPTMIVLANLKEGVDPEDYERWILDSYAPAVRDLPSVANWRDYRTTGLPGSDAAPPYQYVVTLDVNSCRSCTTWPASPRSWPKGSPDR